MGYSLELSKLGINLRGRTSGQVKTDCPSPKHKPGHGKLDLSVNIDEGTYSCKSVNCGWSGCARPKKEQKTYNKPNWVNKTELTDSWLQYQMARGISQDTMVKMGLTVSGKYLCFPFYKGKEVVNVKSRSMEKEFRLVSGAELCFYNFNALYNNNSILICEGEEDCLSYIEAGILNVVSVPNGASIGPMEYLSSVWERIEQLKSVYLSVDNDEPGLILQKELARRIGIDKCYLIDLKECKDANEYLVAHGREALIKAYQEAKPYPLEGVVYVSDMVNDTHKIYHQGLHQGELTGVADIDKYISFEPGYTTVVHGVPSHGKSSWMDMMTIWLSMHNKKNIFGMWSPENFPISRHISRLSSKVIGKPFFGHERMTEDELFDAEDYLQQHLLFINPEENNDIDGILEVARLMVLRYGINFLVIDPYNKTAGANQKEGKDMNVGETLTKVAVFNRKYGVHTFFVVHPRKMQKKPGTMTYEVPTMYDISASSEWYNMCDIGICVYRDGGITQLHIQKRRFDHWGLESINEAVILNYNKHNGRFYSQIEDNSNWLKEKPAEEIQTELPI